jgi:hypothetical protein
MVQQMNKVEHGVPWVIGIPIGLAIVWAIKLLNAPVPIEIFERKADREFVHAGEEVTISWIEVRKAECSSKIHRQLITADGKIVLFEPINSPVKEIGKNEDSFSFAVPPLASEGILTYRAKSQFFCNWMQDLFGGPVLVLPDVHLKYQVKPAAAG